MKVIQNDAVLESRFCVNGDEVTLVTWKRLVPEAVTGQDEVKILEWVNRVIDEMALEHKDYFPKYLAIVRGKEPCTACDIGGKREECRKWCPAWKNWQEKLEPR